MTIHHAHAIAAESMALASAGLFLLALLFVGAFWGGAEFGIRISRRLPTNRTPLDQSR